MKKPLYVLRNGIVVKDLGDGRVCVVSVPPSYVDPYRKDPANAHCWEVGKVNQLVPGGYDLTSHTPDDPLSYKGCAWGKNYDVVAAFDDYSVPSASWILRFLRWLFEGSKE